MKLIGKLISGVAAVAMVISSFAGMTAFADGNQFTSSTTWDKTKNIVELKISYSTDTAAKTAEVHIPIDTDKIDIESYMATFTAEPYEEDLSAFAEAGYITTDLTGTRLVNLSLTYGTRLNIAYMTTKNTAAQKLKTSEDNFITLKLPVKEGQDVSGYEFELKDCTIGSYTQKSGNLSVTNAKVPYTVTCETPTNGTLEVDKSTAAEGDTVTITATPATDYKLGTITVEGKDGTAVTVTADNKFTMPAQDVTVKATFVEDKPAQSDFQKLGSYTSDESDKDKAVAFIQKLTDMVSTKTYQLYAMVGDKKFNCTKTFDLPNITEGAISLGVVIQYNPDEVTPDGFNPENVTSFGVTEVQ